MKKLFSIFFLLLNLRVFAGHFTFGTVGGTASLTSMTGHSMGDTAYIAPGNYTYLEAQNLDSIHILPLDPNNLPVFSQRSRVWANRNCEIGFMRHIYGGVGTSIGWDETGAKGSYNNNYHDLYFYGFSSSVFSAHNNFLYTPGDTTSLMSYKDTYHDIVIDSCGKFFQASFGSISSNSWNPPDVFDSTTFYNIQDIATSLQGGNGQGSGIQGIFFRLTVHDVYITDRSGRGADGDVGWIYLTGGAYHAWNIRKWGGPGYDIRCNDPMSEVNHPFDCWFYNSGKSGGTQYGLINVQAILGDTLANKFYIPNDYSWNLSLIKQINDTNGYWSPLMNMGQVGTNNGVATHHYCWNLLSVDVGNNPQKVGFGPNLNKNQLWVNLGGWPMIGDTLNGIYIKYSTLAGLDSVTSLYTNRTGAYPIYGPTALSPSSILHGGIAGPLATLTADLTGQQLRIPPDKGYLQLQTPTTPLSFTQLSGDFPAPNRGPSIWNGATSIDDVNNPTIPAGNGTYYNRYYRFNWLDIVSSTAPVTYNWTLFDAIFNNAIDNGQMVTFGMMVFCNGCGAAPAGSLPVWVQNDMTAEGKPGWNNGGFIYPNYQSNSLVNDQCTVFRNMANHIATTSHSGKTYTSAFLGFDLRHFGNFGEGAGNYDGVPPAGAQVTDTYLMRMTDSAIAIFPNVQLTIPMNYVAPNNNYNNSAGNTGTQAAYHVLTTPNNYGRIGWRRDNIGDDGYNSYLTGTTATYDPGTGPVPLKPLIMNMWQYAPIGGEPANDLNGVSRCGQPYCDVHNEDTLFHMSHFGDGNYPINSSTSPGWSQLTTNMRAAAAEQGYRLVLTGGNMTTTLLKNSPFTISLNWQNIGNSPVYEKWNVVYTLKNSSGTIVGTWNSTFNPRLFLPSATPTLISESFNLGNVTPGVGYTMFVTVKDPNGYKIPLPLAIVNRQADGSYPIRSNITVSNRNLLIVIQGESNAAGNALNSGALASELLSRSSVQIFNEATNVFENLHIGVNNEQNTFIDNTHHGFELGMANEVDSGFLPNPTYMVKIGVSGSYICQWLPETGNTCRNGNLFTGWMPYVDSAIAHMNALNTPFDIVVWQSLGLNDLYQGHSSTPGHFYDSMRIFLNDFRNRVGRSNVKFYATNFNNPGLQDYAWKFVFDSLAKTDIAYSSISCVGTTYEDAGVHWNYQGMKLVVHNIVDSMNSTQSSPANPVANAGQNQTITSPASSVTLDGSGSSGTITSYLWTQLSGPNTPTITTPSNVTTTVTGLIVGTYTFQLSINNGVSVSQVTVTVLSPANGVSIFTTQFPTGATQGPDQAGGIEVGMKFRSTAAGFITGVKFYKTTGNSGTHIGELYSYPAGTRLGQVTFTNESASGWQSATFTSPISILANTTYEICYFSSAGFYISENDLGSGTSFITAITNPPLTALANNTDGPNGNFSYTNTPIIPTSSFHSGNYYVDVIFSTIPPPCQNCLPGRKFSHKKGALQ